MTPEFVDIEGLVAVQFEVREDSGGVNELCDIVDTQNRDGAFDGRGATWKCVEARVCEAKNACRESDVLRNNAADLRNARIGIIGDLNRLVDNGRQRRQVRDLSDPEFYLPILRFGQN